MEQHSRYIGCTAKEAVEQHWRRYHLMIWIYVLVIISIMVFIICNIYEGKLFIDGIIWELVLFWLAKVVLDVAHGWNANEFLYILFKDCDPQKMYEAMLLLEPKESKKANKSDIYFYIAQSCLFYEGKLDEGFEYLQKVDYKKKIFSKEVSYYSALANYAYLQNDRDAHNRIKNEFKQLPNQIKKHNKKELKNYKSVENYILLKEYLWDEKDSEARTLLNEMLSQEAFLVNRVSFHMYLAKLDLKEQEYTNAKMRLEYVIAHGNTMKAVKEAKELMEQID